MNLSPIDWTGLASAAALALTVAVAMASPLHAQGTDLKIPANAHANAYGDDWRCDAGYRRENDGCIAIAIPQNAFATGLEYGKGWECLRGFAAVGRSYCQKVVVPEGAFLDARGSGWRCKRGYRQLAKRCEKIELPQHAYLTEGHSGSDWECDRGYEKSSGACVPIVVPRNAYLTNGGYGETWKCERGFVKSDNDCVAVAVPRHGFLDDTAYGTGWKCERGYEEKGSDCITLEVPKNAHLDFTGNRWECDHSFDLSDGRCVLAR